MICFCTIGTSSIGSSMPRSPRATITQSAARTISSARVTACGFSIFATSGSRVCLRSSTISSARRTKLSATMSTPIRSPVRTCSRSSSGTAGSAAVSPGMFRPWREDDRAADLDHRVDLALLGADRVDPQADGAVGEVHDLVALDRRGQAGVGDEQPRGVTLTAVGSAHERGRVAGLELHDAVAELADPELRAREVLQDRDLAAGATGGVADPARGFRVLVRAAVGEVQPGDVHPGFDHSGEHLGIAGGGPDGGDDLRAALHQRRTL